MNLPAWLIEQILQEEREREQSEQLEQLRLPLFEEEVSRPKDDREDHYKSIIIEL